DLDHVALIDLAFTLDSADAKEEFDKIKTIKIQPIVIRALSAMSPDEISDAKGKDQLTASLINSVNAVLSEGKLTKVDITNFMIALI
ncbi:MAG: flagellar basal body-associated FliL family protein, partial [Cohnella sp.]|nr:flagellar basal body-associated FliL family protein [Cohnella sp.]